jgi:broad specificity phosphatase PhoE
MFRRTWTPLYLNLALVHSFHDLVGKTCAPFREDFLDLAKKANIRRVGFLRHGNTLPSETGVDFDRLLSDKGREHAKEAGSSFGKDLAPFYHHLLLSPAPRTTETAQIFLQAANVADSNVTLKPVSCLYDGTMQPEGSAIFRKIGYAPLREYVENENAADRATMWALLSVYAQDTVQAMVKVLRDDYQQGSTPPSNSSAAATVWIVGHAIYLPCAALGVASLANCDEASRDLILSTVTQEAEGYLLDLEKSTVQYLQRPGSKKT